MRIGVASAFATGAGLWRRLQDEGNEVKVWRGTMKDDGPALLTSHRYVGQGIVPLTDSWNDLLSWCKESTQRGEPTLMLFDSSGLGKLADEARKAGVHVLGGGGFCDRLEKDRAFGRRIAQQAGIESPGFLEFASVDECLAFANSGHLDRAVYFKTDAYVSGDATHKCDSPEELVEWLTYFKTLARSNIKCILEEKLDGFALSTARYWNGRAWVGPYEATYERKSFMPNNVGPSTGCSINAVFFYEDDEPKIAKALHWERLAASWLEYDAPPGLYDINAIVTEGQARFLEWTPRFGWDSEGTSNLLFDDYSAWLWQVATGQGADHDPRRDEIAMAIRLTVPPAPWENAKRDDKGGAVGVPVRGDVGDLWSGPFIAYGLMEDPEQGLVVAAPEALVGLSAAQDDDVSVLAEECIEFAKESLRVPGLMYWPLGVAEAIHDDADTAAKEGFGDFPEGMTK